MIKDLWAKISYGWFITMLIFAGFFFGYNSVNASELQSWNINQARLVLDDHGSSSFTSWQNNPYTFSNISLPVKNIQFRLKTSDGFSADNTYTFTLQYVPTPDSLAVQSITFFKDGDLTNTETPSCSAWNRTSNGLYSSECSFQPHSNYTSSQYLWVGLTLTTAYQNSVTTGVSNYDERLGVNAVITNQTNIINNSLNSLIEQNNANTQAIIDSQKVCNKIDKNSIVENGKYLISSNGNIGTSSSYGITDYLKVDSKTEITTLVNYNDTYVGYCFYNINKVKVSCFGSNTLVVNQLLTIPIDASYVRFSIYTDQNRPQLNICKSGDQAVTDTLEDDSVDDPNEMLEDFEDLLPENGTITQLIALPITLYTKVLNSINGTCSQFNLGELYETSLIIPCIDISTYLGSTIWNLIDLIISGAFVLVIAKKMIKAFENFTSMKEGDVIND